MDTNKPLTSTSEARARRAARSAEYRAEQKRLASFEHVARFVITRRAELGLTQEQLAERMGTSHSAISRIESGRHKTSVKTLARLADALESELVISFEAKPITYQPDVQRARSAERPSPRKAQLTQRLTS